MAKRTKIVCTLGPSVDSESTLKGLINAGMDIARFNFSHGSHEEQRARMDRLRKVRREMDSPCAILLDTKGPEIRTGELAGHKPVQLMAGNSFTFTEADVEGGDRVVGQTCKGLADVVSPGTVILVDDGLIELAVDSVEGGDIHCTVQNSGLLGERKSMNLPGTSLPLPVMTDQDRADLLFGIEQGVDFIAASFIRDAAGVREMRAFLNEHGGGDIMFLSKIECHEAVENINEIIEASDGIMIARGDLGVEVPAYKVPHIQKEIIAKCNAAYKPVITATQMLDSMQQNPRPTRAEVADVANAIYDGTDAVMLSGESAAGKYPVEAVKMQASIALETEKYLPAHAPLEVPADAHGTRVVNNVVGMSAVNMATTVGAKCITVPTTTGRTARLISHFRPNMPICAFSRHEWAVQQMIMYWGVIPHQAEITQGTVNGTIVKAIETAKELGYVKTGDLTVATAGDPRMSVQLEDKVSSTNVAYVAQVR